MLERYSLFATGGKKRLKAKHIFKNKLEDKNDPVVQKKGIKIKTIRMSLFSHLVIFYYLENYFLFFFFHFSGVCGSVLRFSVE